MTTSGMPDWFEKLVRKSAGRNLEEFRLLESLSNEKQSIKHDRFDKAQYKKVAKAAKELKDLIDKRFEQESWPALIQDDYLSMYKAAPELRLPNEMLASHIVNQMAMSKAMETKEFERLRSYTMLDQWAAAMAAVEFSNKLAEYLDEAKDLLEQQKKTAEKEKELREQLKDLKDQTGDELQQALDDLKKSLDDYEQMREDMQQVAEENSRAIASAARNATKDAKDKAEQTEQDILSFGTDPGQLQRMPHKARMELAARIYQSRKLQELAKLVGRFKRLAIGEQSRKVVHGVDEVHDIEFGNDLNRLLPSEYVLLADEDTEDFFLRKFTERGLMQYKLRGFDKVAKGAIIVCLDQSGSMSGSRELWGKAVALALFEIARRQNRDFHAIWFGSAREIKEWAFPRGQPENVNDVLDMAEFMFNGGTDFETPLSLGIQRLEEKYNDDGTMQGDIVFITDGECAVSEEWATRYINAKEQLGFRVFGCLVGGHISVLDKLCDSTYSVQELASGEDARAIFGMV